MSLGNVPSMCWSMATAIALHSVVYVTANWYIMVLGYDVKLLLRLDINPKILFNRVPEQITEDKSTVLNLLLK